MTREFNLVLMGDGGRSDLSKAIDLKRGRTALVVTDMQYFSACRTTGMGKAFTENGNADLIAWRFDRIEQKLIPNIRRLLECFRKNSLKVIYLTVGSQEYDYSDLPIHIKRNLQTYNGRVGRIEATILDEIKPVENEFVFNKTTVGAFASTPLDSHLRSRGIENMVFTGISTCCCVDTTARAAADLGYRCVIVEDACSDLRKEDHEWTILNFQRFFGRIMSTEEVISEIGSVA